MLSAVQSKKQPIVERRRPRQLKNKPAEGEQLSLDPEMGGQRQQDPSLNEDPPKRKRGRPSNAEIAAREAALQEGKKERKSPERLTEEERAERYFRMSHEFPHPTVFTPKQALERFPELSYLQNAYGFLKSAAKRGYVENMGNGQFRFTEAAASALQTLVGDESEQPEASASKARSTISLKKEPLPTPASQPTSSSTPAPVAAQAAAPVASAIPAPTPSQAPIADVPPRRAVEQTPAPIARPVAEPLPPRVPLGEEEQLGTLLQLSRRYRSERYYNIDELIVPLRECWTTVYGNVEVDTANPPVCVVADAYEPDPKAVNPNDIDVLFLDVHGQAHIRSAASWMFLPYRKE
jgi:hypothetical protein